MRCGLKIGFSILRYHAEMSNNCLFTLKSALQVFWGSMLSFSLIFLSFALEYLILNGFYTNFFVRYILTRAHHNIMFTYEISTYIYSALHRFLHVNRIIVKHASYPLFLTASSVSLIVYLHTTFILLRKPCDGRTDRQTDRQTNT